VEDLDRQVLALLPHQLLGLLLEHLAGPVVGIDDLVAHLELADIDDVFFFFETGLNRFFFYCWNRCLL
jgi:hypothetical protein